MTDEEVFGSPAPSKPSSGMTDEDVFGPVSAPPTAEALRKLRNVNRARALASGAMYSFGDEAEARVRSMMGQGEYEPLVKDIRQQYAQYGKENPGEAMGLELGGGLAGAFVPGVGLTGGIENALMRAGAAGAGAGGLSALGSMEDKFGNLADTAGKVTGGAALGGTLGTVLGAVPKLASGLGNLLQRAPTEAQAAEKAMEIANRAIGRDQTTPSQIYRQALRDEKAGVPSVAGELGGRNLSSLMDTALTVPSEGREALAKELAGLQTGASGRVEERISSNLTNDTNYDVARQNVVDRLKDTFTNEYGPAYARGAVDDPTINQLVNSPSVAPFWGEVMKTMRAKADSLGVKIEDIMPIRLEPILDDAGKAMIDPWSNVPLMRPAGGMAPTVEALDALKKAMDEGIDARFRQNGVSKTEGGFLKDIREGIVNRLDFLVPEYRAARAKYRGDAEVRTAYDIGMGENLKGGLKGVDKLRPNQLEKLIGDMSEAEKEALRVGYGNKLIDNMKKTSQNRNWANEIVNNPYTMDRLSVLYPDSKDLNLLTSALQRESDLFKGRSSALGGSATAGRVAAKADVDAMIQEGRWGDIASLINSGRNGNIFGVATSAVRLLKGENYAPEVYSQIAKLLRTGSAEEIAATMRDLSARYAATVAKDRAVSAGGAGVAAGLAAPLGPTPSGEEPEPFPEGVAIGQEAAAPTATEGAPELPISEPEFEDLVGKVIQQESGGDHSAVSQKGAAGLMQLMPDTARKPGMGIPPVRDDSPEENVRVGAAYLKGLISKYGDVASALAAYNWGPGNFDEWRAGGMKGEIPKETKGYIQNILGVKSVSDKGVSVRTGPDLPEWAY